ncbi:MAG: HAD hydrolase-like protein [Betaproteobacteria bacterium]
MNILFDLDGTLTDPGEGFVACVSYALAKLGCPPRSEPEIRRHVGPPLQETLARLIEDQEKIPHAIELYRERYGAEGLLQCRVYPGIEPALHALLSTGTRLFVATSKPVVFAERIVEHFGLRGFFSGVYGSELDGTRSNKVQLLEHLLREEEISRAVMIGDRAEDIRAALAHGLRAVGALWGYGSREELDAAGATALCEHPSGLATVIQDFRGTAERSGFAAL